MACNPQSLRLLFSVWHHGRITDPWVDPGMAEHQAAGRQIVRGKPDGRPCDHGGTAASVRGPLPTSRRSHLSHVWSPLVSVYALRYWCWTTLMESGWIRRPRGGPVAGRISSVWWSRHARSPLPRIVCQVAHLPSLSDSLHAAGGLNLPLRGAAGTDDPHTRRGGGMGQSLNPAPGSTPNRVQPRVSAIAQCMSCRNGWERARSSLSRAVQVMRRLTSIITYTSLVYRSVAVSVSPLVSRCCLLILVALGSRGSLH